jgi:hypothetical protein
MARAGDKSVFISYARKDGAQLAKQLLSDLQREGFGVWLDTQEIAGGVSWTRDIEEALDRAQVVLALLTSGSYRSEICRAEQLRALRHGKCVIPLLAQRGADIPLHLEAKNYRDFSAPSTQEVRFQELLQDIRGRKGVKLKEEYRQTYVTAPPLPANFVERPEALEVLRNALITDGESRNVALTALNGMGEIGKTMLAQALCHDQVVQQAFPDGIIWITVRKESFRTVLRLRSGAQHCCRRHCWPGTLPGADREKLSTDYRAHLTSMRRGPFAWSASCDTPLKRDLGSFGPQRIPRC